MQSNKNLKLRTNQKKGIFKIPDTIKKRRVIRYFLEDLPKETPRVIADESYTRQSVMRKLGPDRCFNSNRNLVIALINDYGLIRTRDGKRFKSGTPISNLSLTQTISGFFNEPIEEIELTRDYLESREFQRKNPQEQVKMLFNAFSGVKWFEIFKGRFKKHGKTQKIHTWQNLRLRDIHEILGTAVHEPGDKRRNLVRLVENGLILPRDKRKGFKTFNPRNFVNPDGFVELISLLSKKNTKDLVVRTDPYFKELVDGYIDERLVPYLLKNNIRPLKPYTLNEAGAILKIQPHIILERIQKKVLRGVKNKGWKTRLSGLDIAIYGLNRTEEPAFSKEDLKNLFGVPSIEPEKLGFTHSKNGNYARHHYVFPLYDRVAKTARKKLIKNYDLTYGQKNGEKPVLSFADIIEKDKEIQKQLDKIATTKDQLSN